MFSSTLHFANPAVVRNSGGKTSRPTMRRSPCTPSPRAADILLMSARTTSTTESNQVFTAMNRSYEPSSGSLYRPELKSTLQPAATIYALIWLRIRVCRKDASRLRIHSQVHTSSRKRFTSGGQRDISVRDRSPGNRRSLKWQVADWSPLSFGPTLFWPITSMLHGRFEECPKTL